MPDIERAATPTTEPAGRGRMIAGVALLVVALWLVAFIVANTEVVRVSFVFGHAKLSLIWVMIICALLGGSLAFGVPRLRRRHRRAANSPATQGARRVSSAR